MTILVTGATGAVGRRLVGVLAAGGERVRAVSRKPESAGLPAGVEVAGADLGGGAAIGAELFDGVDRMFVFPFEQGVPELDAEVVEISPEEFRQDVGQFVPPEIIAMLLDYWSDTVAAPDPVRSGVRDLTGHSGRTLVQWARDHRSDFT
ncbi:NmrA family NAD(P)-binding protein [Dactylosporangium matsuzakiense]|uniref:NmrA-like domain-containing protein n=1 Tax=Dactylosporangium matsuzakiense TaxID=53360 RepID=A0A9W6KJ05_9ACTN|nr:NmrA family NAD(P)-binding protein [Dactylosporangium matsuzakiense]UWZ41120.1 SDR family oxidoreductase [Dactylosporangium matsuzakiense]GLL00980.1 hypothetical protein GCM10017581_027210 [Dactylosporangium matsuzakiense]